ncbi:PH domain-containing protein [Actinoplanes sp. NPDC048988]|uniref:PH domain-containing protein n=1 Tax=Actinoplanes sp. NPDC048988 TaxID=3363901 RepID=UPI00371594F1
MAGPEPSVMWIRPPRWRVDRRFVLWRTLQALFWGVGVLEILGAVFWWVEGSRGWLGPVLVGLAVVYAVNVAVMPGWRYRVHRWETTDDAVYALEGWLTKKWQIVPLSRIQSIDTEAGPLQQVLGIATIKVTTASSEGKISIEGLDVRVARETVERLREVTAATPGDAT